MEKVGTALFEETHKRSAQNPQELWSWISAQKNRVRQPVAGQDLVFTPPKSVSTMWLSPTTIYAARSNESTTRPSRAHSAGSRRKRASPAPVRRAKSTRTPPAWSPPSTTTTTPARGGPEPAYPRRRVHQGVHRKGRQVASSRRRHPAPLRRRRLPALQRGDHVENAHRARFRTDRTQHRTWPAERRRDRRSAAAAM